MRGRTLLVVCCSTYLLLLVIAALAAPAISQYGYDEQHAEAAFQSASRAHLLGTDNLGRDMATRLMYGGRVSLGVGLTVVISTVVLGCLVGILAGLEGRWLDSLLMRFTDGLFAFPDILLAILILGVLGPSALTVILALTAVGWPAMARLVRGQTLSLRESLFVRAAVASGAGRSHVVLRHLLPHLTGILLAASMIELSSVILAESALSFLGIGIRPPVPSWGSLINTGREFMRVDWMLVFLPCLVLTLTVISLNLQGDLFKERLDSHR